MAFLRRIGSSVTKGKGMFDRIRSPFSSPIQRRTLILRRYPVTETQPTKKFRDLFDQSKSCLLTYIWIDGTGENLRGKTKVALGKPPEALEDVPSWSYDGSSCFQADGPNSDLILNPIAMCRDPFFPGHSKLILCDVKDPDGRPAKGNNRHVCLEAVKLTEAERPWFSFEQEYTLMGVDRRPFGFPEYGYPPAQGHYYCSVGAGLALARDIADAHMLACVYAQLDFEGTNAEVLCGQWEYQIGPCIGVEVADQLWLSRYILHRVAEEFGAGVSFDPKPVAGEWNGTGNHCNFSTDKMRQEGGIGAIRKACGRLSQRHPEHMAVYAPDGGDANRRRLTGTRLIGSDRDSASFEEFTWGEGKRNVSVRIPLPCVIEGKGWLEDRRPSANCDPYRVIDRILRTTLIDKQQQY